MKYATVIVVATSAVEAPALLMNLDHSLSTEGGKGFLSSTSLVYANANQAWKNHKHMVAAVKQTLHEHGVSITPIFGECEEMKKGDGESELDRDSLPLLTQSARDVNVFFDARSNTESSPARKYDAKCANAILRLTSSDRGPSPTAMDLCRACVETCGYSGVWKLGTGAAAYYKNMLWNEWEWEKEQAHGDGDLDEGGAGGGLAEGEDPEGDGRKRLAIEDGRVTEGDQVRPHANPATQLSKYWRQIGLKASRAMQQQLLEYWRQTGSKEEAHQEEERDDLRPIGGQRPQELVEPAHGDVDLGEGGAGGDLGEVTEATVEKAASEKAKFLCTEITDGEAFKKQVEKDAAWLRDKYMLSPKVLETSPCAKGFLDVRVPEELEKSEPWVWAMLKANVCVACRHPEYENYHAKEWSEDEGPVA